MSRTVAELLLERLTAILSLHVGETGESEGAVDILKRIILERNRLRAQLQVAQQEELRLLRHLDDVLESMKP